MNLKKISGFILLIIGLIATAAGVMTTASPAGTVMEANWETTHNAPVPTTDQRFVIVGVLGLVSLIMGTVLTMHSYMTAGEIIVEHEIEKERGEIPVQPSLKRENNTALPQVNVPVSYVLQRWNTLWSTSKN